MKNGNNNKHQSESEIQDQLDAEIKKLQAQEEDIHSELMKPNLGMLFVGVWVFTTLAASVPLLLFLECLVSFLEKRRIFTLPFPLEPIYIIVLLAIIIIGYAHFQLVLSLNKNINTLNRVTETLKKFDVESESFDIKTTNQYALVLKIRNSYVLGAFIAACMWFLMPEQGRFESLTIIYGSATAIFEYIRARPDLNASLQQFVSRD